MKYTWLQVEPLQFVAVAWVEYRRVSIIKPEIRCYPVYQSRYFPLTIYFSFVYPTLNNHSPWKMRCMGIRRRKINRKRAVRQMKKWVVERKTTLWFNWEKSLIEDGKKGERQNGCNVRNISCHAMPCHSFFFHTSHRVNRTRHFPSTHIHTHMLVKIARQKTRQSETPKI